ncbi:hypothetical protein LZZ85_24365 [Terrimonas sp. NA20]|uniref:Uncharacterized protein n=1 Tax=Terrimonas ginsenosidimutans TaxID=2908004 RepID=A0ABS9KYN6_9BACT|nr:hypothetical protein [Terrimonas ginsenosidimutans]MCG2617455.1 hypothetical protein [Terrimonas ginsenosidimutans]
MSIENRVKKEIAKKWVTEFPELKIFAQNKLYKVVGPFVGGVEIFKQPGSDDYRPYIAWYPLWKSDIKECFKEEAILQEVRNSKGILCDIPFEENDKYFADVADKVKQIPSSLLFGNVFLSNVFELIDRQFSHTLVKSSPVEQAKLLQVKLFSALYVNGISAVENVFEEVIKASLNWRLDLFEWKYGKLDDWLQKLKEVQLSRDEIMHRIRINKEDKIIRQLNSFELIG